ncbi:MAG: nitroreductase family protein [Bacteroidales bacterium]|nr:nitroreductase family protein [Bacteroidales bacterium]
MDNEKDIILERVSVREYTDEAITPEQCERLLRAAMAAPSACNRQPWQFVVVNDHEILGRIADAEQYMKMARHAPMAILVCGDLELALPGRESEFWVQDCSAATENILLEARNLGLGAVWTGIAPMQEREDFFRRLLNLPANITPLCLVVVGHPARDRKPLDKWKPERIHYNGW